MTPYDGEKNVSPVNLQMDITFSEAVDASTIKMSNVSVSGNAYAAVIATGEKKATVYFNRLYVTLGAKYTVILKSGIKSLAGASLEEKKVTFSIVKDAPAYRQITNPDMSDTNNIYGLDQEAWKSASIARDNGNHVIEFHPGWAEASVRQLVYCKGGHTYTARARVKTTETQKIWLVLSWTVQGDANDYHQGPKDSIKAGEWTTLEFTWTVPEEADISNIKQWIAVENAGTTVYVDDWQFFEKDHDEDPPTADSKTADSRFTYLSEKDDVIERLKAFGMLSGGVTEKSPITRIDLAKTLLRIVGFETVPEAENFVKFTDVSEDETDVVSAAYSTGLMNGWSETEFQPDESVTVDQVLKSVLNVMGWSSIADERGGYPLGYRKVAAELGILKNIDADFGKPLSCSDFAKLIDNALTADVLNVKIYNNATDSYTIERGGTIMDTYLKYVSGTGMIEGTDKTYLYKNAKLPKNQVCIGGVIYECDADLSPYLGYEAEYYYEENKDSGYDRIVYICGMGNKNTVEEFSTFDDNVGYYDNTYKVTLHEGINEKRYKINTDKNVIYNGKYLGSYTETEETFVPKYGSVKLIDNGNGYSTVVITDIRTITVSAVDYDKKIVYDYATGEPLDLSECDELVMMDNEGSDYGLRDIKRWYVLSAIYSKDKKLAMIYVSNTSLSGSVCSVEKDGNTANIIIGDVFYGPNVQSNAKTVNGYFDDSKLNLGTTGTFFADYLGRIAAFNVGAVSGRVGYLVDAGLSSVLNAGLSFKIYDISDKMLYLDGADHIKINNTVAKTSDEAIRLLKNETSDVVSQLILYKTNSDGEITFIDSAYNKLPNCDDYRTVQPDSGDDAKGFRVTYSSVLPPNSSAALAFSPYSRSFSGKVQLPMNPTMFFVPLDAKNDDEIKFQISHNFWDLGDMGTAKIEAYQTNSDSLIADYVVVFIDANKYTTEHLDGYQFGLVRKITNVLIDDIATAQVEFVNGTKIYSETKPWFEGVKIGDYIEYRRDKRGYLVSAAKVIFDASAKTVNGSNPYGGFNDYNRMFYAKAYEKHGSELKLVSAMNDLTTSGDLLDADITSVSSANIYVYDSERKTIENGSINDILDYEGAGEDCSDILILSEKSVAHTVLVVR